MKIKLLLCLVLVTAQINFSQSSKTQTDNSINNLIHISGYKPCEFGTIPDYIKQGRGSKTIILIPGLGFEASVFKDFMDANEDKYKMYAVTIPGFGKTSAPAMPDTTVSYGEQTWNKGVIQGIMKLIEKEKIVKPIIAGHFTLGTQIALRMAIDFPEKFSGVIIFGGVAKFIGILNGEIKDSPLSVLVQVADKYSAPVWFKRITKSTWDNGNYRPEVYSLDTVTGNALWNQVAHVPVPVMVRYLCEYIASDLKSELEKLKCPMVVLRATFNQTVLENPINNYLNPQFVKTWEDAPKRNSVIQVIDIPNSATFVWKDSPKQVNKIIEIFLANK
jgi:pimeloyl-ACP methyl ester carboxylesterase